MNGLLIADIVVAIVLMIVLGVGLVETLPDPAEAQPARITLVSFIPPQP